MGNGTRLRSIISVCGPIPKPPYFFRTKREVIKLQYSEFSKIGAILCTAVIALCATSNMLSAGERLDRIPPNRKCKNDGGTKQCEGRNIGTMKHETVTVEVVPNSWTTGGRKQERGPGRRCVRVRCECAGCR